MPKTKKTAAKKTSSSSTAVMKVANAKTLAGQYRQVATGRAERTRGGLTANDIIQNKSGRYVSKKKSERMSELTAGGKASNPWWDLMQKAKENNEQEFEYTKTNGEKVLYVQHTTKTGLKTYKRAS